MSDREKRHKRFPETSFLRSGRLSEVVKIIFVYLKRSEFNSELYATEKSVLKVALSAVNWVQMGRPDRTVKWKEQMEDRGDEERI